jgi:hypothetical protein
MGSLPEARSRNRRWTPSPLCMRGPSGRQAGILSPAPGRGPSSPWPRTVHACAKSTAVGSCWVIGARKRYQLSPPQCSSLFHRRFHVCHRPRPCQSKDEEHQRRAPRRRPRRRSMAWPLPPSRRRPRWAARWAATQRASPALWLGTRAQRAHSRGGSGRGVAERRTSLFPAGWRRGRPTRGRWWPRSWGSGSWGWLWWPRSEGGCGCRPWMAEVRVGWRQRTLT